MQRARDKKVVVAERELDIKKFYGLNTFGPHAKDAPGQFRVLNNFDNYSEYEKERRGSVKFGAVEVPDYDILSYVVVDTGDLEFVVLQMDNGLQQSIFFSAILDEAYYLQFTPVTNKVGFADYILDGTEKCDMHLSNGKVYVFHEEGNSVFEFDSTIEGFVRRKMGLPAPQITSIETFTGPLDGKRVYGVELVYKDTTVTPAVDLIVSGPNRAIELLNPSFGEGRLAYTLESSAQALTVKISATTNDSTLLTDSENSNWTHIRLYRSKDITTATNAAQDLIGESEITGRPDELFQVQEMDKETFLATWDGSVYSFDTDYVLDDDMPFPLSMITISRLEMIPVPTATIGVYHNNRIWVSGVKALWGSGGLVQEPAIESKIYYTPESDTKYSESVRSLTAIESDPGDGQRMIKLFSFKEDLLGIKEGKTGRVRNGNPDNGWVTEDEVIGISHKEFAQYVPDIGICARVNDQSDFRIFGFDLLWTNKLAGQEISRPIRNIISTFDADDIDFIYINGKLMISGGKAQLLVLAVEQQAGWSTYTYPLQDLSEAMFTFAQGTRAMILSQGQYGVEIEAEDTEGNYISTDFRTIDEFDATVELDLTTYKFQDNGGRSLMEERFISIVAKASEKFTIQAYSNGKAWQTAFESILDPTDYPDSELRETEYQAYAEYRAIGNYLHYEIYTTAPCTIYSIMLNTLIQRGSIRPGFDPFLLLEGVNDNPSWIEETEGDIVETGAAADTTTETGTATDTITEDGV